MTSTQIHEATTVPHPTVEERHARGRAARDAVPRESHAAFEPAADRPDPVELLERQAAARVPELVPIRYGRMLVSPFTFYRGAALIMAADLANSPVSGIQTQLCGDAHLSNFGLFASAERKLVFDLNDFDETHPGPWEWDVKRLAASMTVAARSLDFPLKQRVKIVRATVAGYREAMAQFAGMKNLEVFYARIDAQELASRLQDQLSKEARKRLEKTITKAQTSDSMKAFAKLTREVDGEPRIISQPPLIEPLDELLPAEEAAAFTANMRELLRAYRATLETDRREALENFRIVDIARKVVGVGSVGTRAWIMLLLGRDSDDPLFLQFKEAQASVLEEFTQPSTYDQHGHRVVAGQRLMQAAGDPFLGWQQFTGVDGVTRDFYARQLKDWKGSFEATSDTKVEGALLYGRTCGWTLARAHARSGDRVAIAAYLGRSDAFDRAIAEFSEAYADQNERDYAALEQAAKDGRITVQSGY
jgi:uncharacterized protein (DUF2252 family)